jgi:glycosyltransferase involved in cell wall biosynthesis
MITVAIPAFKTRFLADAIKSVLCQTYADYEVIIVNDASPEDIGAIVGDFKDKRIKYFTNESRLGKDSVVQNWNACLRHATGEFFVLFSDDDLYESTFLSEMLLLATEYPRADVFHCRVRIIDEHGKTIDYAPLCPAYETAISFIWHRVRDTRLQFAPDFLCRTAALNRIGGFVDLPQAWGADDATWSKLAIPGGIGYTQNTLCSWRKSDVNISRIGDVVARFEALNEYRHIIEEVIAQCQCVSREDYDMLTGALERLPGWVASRKSDLLLSGDELGVLATIWHLTSRWLAYRHKYELSSRTYLKALSQAASKMMGNHSG